MSRCGRPCRDVLWEVDRMRWEALGLSVPQLPTAVPFKREVSPAKCKEQGTCLGFASDVGADEWQKPSY